MAEAGVDLLVVNSNDRSTHGHGNIHYLTDIATHFESSCCLVAGEGLGIDTMVASEVANSRPIIARTTFGGIKPQEIIHLSIIPKY